MTDLKFADTANTALPLDLVASETFEKWYAKLSTPAAHWIKIHGFKGGHGSCIVIPGSDGRPERAAVGVGSQLDRGRHRFALAAARSKLPEGCWFINEAPDVLDLPVESLGWLLDGYRYSRYRKARRPRATLVPPKGVNAPRVEAVAAGEALTRDLINTPAIDMGPVEIEKATRALADNYGARVSAVTGAELLSQNLPLIHTVGAASPRAPRLIDMRWGKSGPELTLVGKGVAFDTGGLNLKPGASMALMKKDMGGAATVLGLASMIMSLSLPLRLRVLIPAVENSVAGEAFRPGDILTSRKGLTVEINNTDAEGRLILADALSLADEDRPDLIVSMATLTGAARVAVGPDLAPFYATSDADADAISAAGGAARDPVWRMPFWDPYDTLIEPGIADLDNAPKGGFAGSITAALFLRRFVTDTPRYLHFDIFGWQPTAAPGRPRGGAGQGARAVLDALPDLLSL